MSPARPGGPVLTALDAANIRDEYGSSDVTQKMLARRYGVSVQTINDIIKGRSWRPTERKEHGT